jgi:hypothetical protein
MPDACEKNSETGSLVPGVAAGPVDPQERGAR